MRDRKFLATKGISFMVFPFMMSCVITYYFIKAMFITKQWYYGRMTAFALFLLVIWGVFFFMVRLKGGLFMLIKMWF